MRRALTDLSENFENFQARKYAGSHVHQRECTLLQPIIQNFFSLLMKLSLTCRIEN